MNIKKIVLVSSVTLALSLSLSSANAGICSRGVIEEIKEGGWSSNDLFIKMDYRNHANQHSGTEWVWSETLQTGYMRFRANNLSADKMKSIRSLAYMALATGPRLFEVRSSTGDCANSDEVSIYNDVY